VAIESILKEIDAEIARLQEVKKVLSGAEAQNGFKGHTVAKKRKRRKLSAEAREKIAAAQRKRWAAVKKTAKK
jgi:hypothetical protein